MQIVLCALVLCINELHADQHKSFAGLGVQSQISLRLRYTIV